MIVDRRENIEAKISARQEQAYKARILAQCMKNWMNASSTSLKTGC